jgi:hypothetical protein
MIPMPSFTESEAQRASDEWGANCGPGALAAALDLSLDQVRPHLGDFETKRYTNPSMMFSALRSLEVRWRSLQCSGDPETSPLTSGPSPGYPVHGLCRVQWEGPWTAPGVPIAARYRKTHWIATHYSPDHGLFVFDINAVSAGGWITEWTWRSRLVPWLLRECVPRASGGWHLTHRIELDVLCGCGRVVELGKYRRPLLCGACAGGAAR